MPNSIYICSLFNYFTYPLLEIKLLLIFTFLCVFSLEDCAFFKQSQKQIKHSIYR